MSIYNIGIQPSEIFDRNLLLYTYEDELSLFDYFSSPAISEILSRLMKLTITYQQLQPYIYTIHKREERDSGSPISTNKEEVFEFFFKVGSVEPVQYYLRKMKVPKPISFFFNFLFLSYTTPFLCRSITIIDLLC